MKRIEASSHFASNPRFEMKTAESLLYFQSLPKAELNLRRLLLLLWITTSYGSSSWVLISWTSGLSGVSSWYWVILFPQGVPLSLFIIPLCSTLMYSPSLSIVKKIFSIFLALEARRYICLRNISRYVYIHNNYVCKYKYQCIW